MTFIAGLLFLFRGVLACLAEFEYEPCFLYDPFIRFVVPDVVPVICIVEVLLPFGVVSYAIALVRPVEVMLGCSRRPSSQGAAASPVTQSPLPETHGRPKGTHLLSESSTLLGSPGGGNAAVGAARLEAAVALIRE